MALGAGPCVGRAASETGVSKVVAAAVQLLTLLGGGSQAAK